LVEEVYRDQPLSETTLTLRFNGTGVAHWYGVGLTATGDVACKCADGYFADAGDNNPQARYCTPQPSCRFPLTKCRVCFYGHECAASALLACEGQTYAFGGASSCSPCQAGWICENGNTEPCGRTNTSLASVTSEGNAWIANANNSACVVCPAGHYCNSGTAEECVPGKYSPGGLASHQCVNCKPGTYASGNASSECADCPAGKTSHYGSAQCHDCEEGHFSGNGTHPCESCPPGFYAGKGQAQCTGCEPGRYAPVPGMHDCVDCPGGLSTAGNATSVDDCV